MTHLSTEILSIFIINLIILALFAIAFFASIKISINYNINKLSAYQYNLVKLGYLISTIIAFAISIKLPIFIYFIWSLDDLSRIITGAMCAAGVLSASKYGTFMLASMVLNLFLLCGWLFLNKLDLKSPLSPYMRVKFILFLPIFLLSCIEFCLQIIHFSHIQTTTPVACCSVIFSQKSIFYTPFYYKTQFILSIFFIFYILFSICNFMKKPLLSIFFSILFALSCIYALIRFFSPYIYELPTHLCPFCVLQSEYYFIGYLLYLLIFLGLLGSWFNFILYLLHKNTQTFWYKLSLYSYLALVIILCFYPISYFIKNGVWL